MYKQEFLQHPDNLSIQQEPIIEYEYTENFIHVSSVDRDRVGYPQPQEYRINLDNDLKNIHSVELINAVIPDANNVNLEPYLILQIDELPNINMYQSRDTPKDAFTVMYFEDAPGNFLTLKSANCDKIVKTYKTPLARLDRITLRILDYTGAPFSWGVDTSPPTAVTKALQNSFVFKVVTVEKKRKSLGVRNVF